MPIALPENSLPHFLRVARALAIVASVTGAGCARSVVPESLDGAALDTADVARNDAAARDAIAADTDPCASPGPTNSPCSIPGVACGMSGCEQWVCQPGVNGGAATWRQNLCGGPLDPPDLELA